MSDFGREQDEIPPAMTEDTYVMDKNELTTLGGQRKAEEALTTLDPDKIKNEEAKRNEDIRKAMEQLKRAA